LLWGSGKEVNVRKRTKPKGKQHGGAQKRKNGENTKREIPTKKEIANVEHQKSIKKNNKKLGGKKGKKAISGNLDSALRNNTIHGFFRGNQLRGGGSENFVGGEGRGGTTQ